MWSVRNWDGPVQKRTRIEFKLRSRELRDELLQRFAVLDVQAGLRAVDLPHEAAQNLSRTNLYKSTHAICNERLDQTDPLDSACDLLNQLLARNCSRRDRSCIYVANHRDLWIGKVYV